MQLSALIRVLWVIQVSGNFGVAKDALAEIASRLRVRTLRDANAGAESAPVGPARGFGSAGSMPGGGFPPSGPMGAGSSGRYDPLKVPFYLLLCECLYF
jgi:hypothetical protein